MPCRIFSFISSRKPFDKANVTISAATPMLIPRIAAIEVAEVVAYAASEDNGRQEKPRKA